MKNITAMAAELFVMCWALADRTFCIEIVQPMNTRSIVIVERRNIRRRGK